MTQILKIYFLTLSIFYALIILSIDGSITKDQLEHIFVQLHSLSTP